MKESRFNGVYATVKCVLDVESKVTPTFVEVGFINSRIDVLEICVSKVAGDAINNSSDICTHPCMRVIKAISQSRRQQAVNNSVL